MKKMFFCGLAILAFSSNVMANDIEEKKDNLKQNEDVCLNDSSENVALVVPPTTCEDLANSAYRDTMWDTQNADWAEMAYQTTLRRCNRAVAALVPGIGDVSGF